MFAIILNYVVHPHKKRIISSSLTVQAVDLLEISIQQWRYWFIVARSDMQKLHAEPKPEKQKKSSEPQLPTQEQLDHERDENEFAKR